MNREEAIKLMIEALSSAEKKHPIFPEDLFEALAVVTEEVGEVAKAIYDVKHAGADPAEILNEAAQVAAMGVRFLMNLPSGAEILNQLGRSKKIDELIAVTLQEKEEKMAKLINSQIKDAGLDFEIPLNGEQTSPPDGVRLVLIDRTPTLQKVYLYANHIDKGLCILKIHKEAESSWRFEKVNEKTESGYHLYP